MLRTLALLCCIMVCRCIQADEPAAGQPLRIMTFNVWSGENTTGGRNKLVEIIEASQADIVGLQEMGNTAGQQVASALGMYYQQQSGGDIQVLSRFPIVNTTTSGRGVQISLAEQTDVWLFNSHLAAYPYQPYDLRDGALPMDEAAVIAAAEAARGATVDSYLGEMQSLLQSGQPVFFTGDFNEPSHLDWTAEAATATLRPYDLQVAYPASSKIVAAGMTDSFRAVRPDEVNDPGYTWTPGYPPPNQSRDEVHDRIDIVYHSGIGVTPSTAEIIGPDYGDGISDIEVAGYNADHRAVVVEYLIDSDFCFVFGDLNGDCLLDTADWVILRDNQRADLSGLSFDEARALGDLNGDYRNDFADYSLFKRAFIDQQGSAAWAEMTNGIAAVPEPDGIMLAVFLATVGIAAKALARFPKRFHSL
ncbi:endonuclease/exonuclease/phosphatase family protein [Aeoliella mucimassa]|nr:endonuclease/exonuclease/phosphatase family protein [Aeoliella mucimassa]